MDNQMSWKSAEGEHCHLLDNRELRPPTAQPIQHREFSSTTQAVRALQPSVQLAAQPLDLSESTHHSATLAGLAPEFLQLPAVQSAHHTPLAQQLYSPSPPIQHTGQHVHPGHQPAQQAPPTTLLLDQPAPPLTHSPALYTPQPAQPAPPQPRVMPQLFPTTVQQQSYPQPVQHPTTPQPGPSLGYQPASFNQQGTRPNSRAIPPYQPPTDPGAVYSPPQTGYPPVAQPQLYQSGSQSAAH